jgi:adenylate cyclase
MPGDASFGDPMSTTGGSPAHILGRRAWTLQDGRFSLLSELVLAALQIADWLEADVRGVASSDEQSVLFVDLQRFSRWALRAEEGEVAQLLRQVDALVTEAVEAHGGVVVKRLGDGAMAVFPDCELALEAAFEAIAAVQDVEVGSYQAVLRAGLHVGRPERIGTDYVGLVVNVAARLCEAAPGGGVLVSGAVSQRVGDGWSVAHAPGIKLRGVPDEVSIHFAGRLAVTGDASAM